MGNWYANPERVENRSFVMKEALDPESESDEQGRISIAPGFVWD
jgi:hypothetical protein